MNTFSHLFEANEGKRMRDIMILKAGSILYSFHEEEDSNIYSYHNRVLHCNFHPFESNSIIDCKYVSFIKLERDIYLLVMLDTIIGKTLISNLDNSSYDDLLKLCDQTKTYGWFSSVRSGVRGFIFSEITLLNDPSLFSIQSTSRYKHDLKKIDIYENQRMRIWGSNYPICSEITLHLHERFRSLIENYKAYNEKSYCKNSAPFQIVLKSAYLFYYE